MEECLPTTQWTMSTVLVKRKTYSAVTMLAVTTVTAERQLGSSVIATLPDQVIIDEGNQNTITPWLTRLLVL